MKKIAFFIAIAIVSIIISCTNVTETEEYKVLQAKNDSLENLASSQNADAISYLMNFNSIQENLNEIKQKENIISINKADIEDLSKQEQIKKDIDAIYNLLKENQEKLKALNKKYQRSGKKNKELRRLIATLNQQIADKNSEIQSLSTELDSLNIEIKDLSDALTEVSIQNETQAEIIEKQSDELQTAYYAVGTSQELQEQKVISKEGGFIGIGKSSKLDDDFNKDYFTEINTANFNKITIFASKATVLTTHPKNSYEFEGTDKKVDYLIIKNSKDFWSVSKYLVIVVKK